MKLDVTNVVLVFKKLCLEYVLQVVSLITKGLVFCATLVLYSLKKVLLLRNKKCKNHVLLSIIGLTTSFK